jgi:hypothetical protein
MTNMATKIKVESMLDTQSKLRQRLQRIERSWRGGVPIWRASNGAWEEHQETVEAIKDEIDRLDDEIITAEMAERDPEQDAEIRAELYGAMAMNGVYDDVSLYMHTEHQERLFQQSIYDQVGREMAEEAGYCDESGYCPMCHSYTDDWVVVEGEAVCYQNCYDDLRAFAEFLTNFMSDSFVFHESTRTMSFWFDENDPEDS